MLQSSTADACKPSSFRQYRIGLVIGSLALLASAKSWAFEPAQVAEKTGAGNVIVGKEKADAERCQECHGVGGISGDSRIPNHAGQYAAYLIKQLLDFQSGARTHDTMSIMAADLTAQDRADIAAYFASQPPMHGNGEGNPQHALGKKLFEQGDPARNLPACASCHGEQGRGRVADNVVYPVLGGQRKVYLRTQLVNWKLVERKNSAADGAMNKVANLLSDDEIDALTSYLSGL